VNNTFYRLPPDSTFVSWREQTPDGFVMAIKASRYLTHMKRLHDPADPVERLLELTAKLGPRAGPMLFQLPPTMRADEGLLRGVLAAIGGRVRSAFEFRHPSWINEPCLQALTENGAAIVLADRPGERYRPIVTADWTYVRFHKGTPRSPSYPMAKLARWADRLRGLGVAEGFIYFNNDEGGAAPNDARRLRALLGGA
jgi:uncharacterized protein YecE (DUF72 family)